MATLYVPFTQADAGDSVQQCQRITNNTGAATPFWKIGGAFKSFQERNFRVIYLDSAQDLRVCGMNSQIYVQAHGGEGLDYICSSTGTQVTPAALAQQFISRKLSKTFAGKLKIMACEGAKGDNSFVEAFSREMGKAGYHLCGIYGYSETFWIYDNIAQLQGNTNHTNTTKYHKTAGPDWVNSPAAHETRRKFYGNKTTFF